MNNRIENQNITETIQVQELISGASVGTWQANYQLTAVEFEHLKNGKPVLFIWSTSLFLTTIGFSLNLVAKVFSVFDEVEQTVTTGEWVTLSLGAGISLLLFAIGSFLPNNKKRVQKTISDHFESSPRMQHVMQGEQK